VTGQIILVPPYFENLGKRLIKSPKVYLGDSGLACYLLGLTSVAELERSPFLGALFEGFVAAEILKSQADRGMRKELLLRDYIEGMPMQQFRIFQNSDTDPYHVSTLYCGVI
jgi:predicted AAA+ superfamily ATPase